MTDETRIIVTLIVGAVSTGLGLFLNFIERKSFFEKNRPKPEPKSAFTPREEAEARRELAEWLGEETELSEGESVTWPGGKGRVVAVYELGETEPVAYIERDLKPMSVAQWKRKNGL